MCPCRASFNIYVPDVYSCSEVIRSNPIRERIPLMVWRLLYFRVEFQIQAEIQEVSLALRESTKNLCRNLKDNPNISGNLLKIQRERTELIDLLNTSCRQIAEVCACLMSC